MLAQNIPEIPIEKEKWNLSEWMQFLEDGYDIDFSYSPSLIDMEAEFSLPVKSFTIDKLLEEVSQILDLDIKRRDKKVLIKPVSQQTGSATISGYIKDEASGEPLIGATVRITGTITGTITNAYGFYSLTLPKGIQSISISYMGYKTQAMDLDLTEDQTLTIEMIEDVSVLEDVVVTDKRLDENITAVRMGTERLSMKQIESIPVIFGEVDLIKVIKLLPGVQMTGETSSGFSVRGGNFDQNLILLDEAVVYNPSHLLGLFSTFNNDAINNVDFYKGVFPVRYGGRVSSVVDVRMREGNNKEFSARGGISAISSRLTVEAPIVKNKGSVLLSARRTYADLVYRAVRPKEGNNKLYFYDFNAKANYSINENNKVYLSSYMGRDILSMEEGQDDPSFNWGNITTTLRWNHIYNSRLFSNLSLIYSNYDYKLGFGSEDLSFSWKSRLRDLSSKMDFEFNLNNNNMLEFGFISTLHRIRPGLVTINSKDLEGSLDLPINRAFEHGLYLGNEQKVSSKLTLNYGLRATLMQNMGATKAFVFDENFETTDSVKYKKGEIYNSYFGLEPRFNASYMLSQTQSVKLGYSRTLQFLHLASNSISGTPLDIWIPSSPNVKPQKVDQVSAGYFRNFFNNKLELSVEGYYKFMHNQIDFRDHAELFLNEEIEGELRFGTAQSLGAEFKISKPTGRLTGWISYTRARTERKFKDIADGKPYLSPFDRTHNVSVVANYELNERFSLSGNWVLFSGLPFTAPSGRFVYGGEIVPTYTERNGDRLPNYHRMDVGLTYNPKKNRNRKFKSTWNVSVYNVYNRRNPNMIRFQTSDTDPLRTSASQVSIFPIIPTVTWNFEF